MAYDWSMRFAHLLWPGLLAAGMAFGQTQPPPDAGFDCWVGADGKPYYTHYIRCIADLDIAHNGTTEERLDDAMALLHREVHGGSSATSERIFKANIEHLSGVWNIRIHSYPSDWSWQDGMPERLVRNVLCPQQGRCSVLIRK
jgi:hypothetical protein